MCDIGTTIHRALSSCPGNENRMCLFGSTVLDEPCELDKLLEVGLQSRLLDGMKGAFEIDRRDFAWGILSNWKQV